MKICTRSLFFDPQDIQLPVIRFEFQFVERVQYPPHYLRRVFHSSHLCQDLRTRGARLFRRGQIQAAGDLVEDGAGQLPGHFLGKPRGGEPLGADDFPFVGLDLAVEEP